MTKHRKRCRRGAGAGLRSRRGRRMRLEGPPIAALPIGQLVLFLLAALILLGMTERVLDRMRMTDTTALLLIAVLFVAPFAPEINLSPSLRLDLAGALAPLGVVVYLIATADRRYEQVRAVIALLVTAAAIFAYEQLLPPEPTQSMVFDLDPLWTTGLIAGIVGYLSGRSRRSAFIAGVGGVALNDLLSSLIAGSRGHAGAMAAIGGAGAFDAVILGGVFAVVFAELVGETREYFARRRGRTAAEAGGARSDDAPDAAPQHLSTTTGLVLAVLLTAGGLAAGEQLHGSFTAHSGDAVYQFLDQDNRLINMTSFVPAIGDRWINADNEQFEVFHIQGRRAWARSLGTVTLQDEAVPATARPAAFLAQGDDDAGGQGRGGLLDWLRNQFGGGDETKHTILILHAHNAESYEPTDGEAMTDGIGGIHRVGERLAAELSERGFNVIHDETVHLPHDRGAYRRARRTIASQLAQTPTIVLDIHRDAVPDRELYTAEIDGNPAARVRFVVGRQNPNRAQNLNFAKELKAIADELADGLILDIYEGKGSYNQDLGPRVMLLELGTHENSREEAERSAAIIADVIERYVERHIGRAAPDAVTASSPR